jgi:hypothetical protein
LSERLLQVLIGIVPLLATLVYLIYKGRGDISFEYVACLVVVGLLMGAIAVVVVSITDHFAWYAFCVFLGVGVMIAVANYVRTQDHPKVSPVAALNGRSPVIGFFVAETSEALYVGRPQPAGKGAQPDSMGFDRERATLLRIPKDSVTDLTIGPLMNADKAYRRSLQLAIALCRRAGASAGRTKTVPCGAREEKLLENRLEKAPAA